MFQRRVREGLTRKFEGYEPESLQFFNPALLANFVPEALSEDYKDVTDVFVSMYSSFQLEDSYNAFQYAEREIIPNLKPKNLQQLNPDILIKWIKTVHAYSASSLGIDYDRTAGEYTKDNILRWTKTVAFSDDFLEVLKNNGSLQALFDHYELTHLARPFEKIINKLRKDRIIKIPDSILAKTYKGSSPENIKIGILLHKIVFGHHQHFFSDDEEIVIDQVVKIGMPVEKIPTAMESFATELCGHLLSCDGTEKEVVKIAAFAFRDLTEIHPFFNGNGRTATILMNSILIGFGFPCIIFRTNQETEDPNSTYNQAVDHISTDIGFLEKHIEKKLEEAKTVNLKEINKLYHDQFEKQKDCVELFYKMLWLIRENLNNKEFNLYQSYNVEFNQMARRWLTPKDNACRPLTSSIARFQFPKEQSERVGDIFQESQRTTSISKLSNSNSNNNQNDKMHQKTSLSGGFFNSGAAKNELIGQYRKVFNNVKTISLDDNDKQFIQNEISNLRTLTKS